MRFDFVQNHQDRWPVKVMCRVLGVTRSGFYEWRKRPKSERAVRHQDLAEKATRSFHLSGRTYGSPRIQQDLEEQGERWNVKTIAKTMKETGLYALRGRRFRPQTTQSDHDYPIAPNRLEQEFVATGPDKVWVADITYVATREGWLYLAAILDVWSRKIVGWSMANHLRARLVCDALRMSIAGRRPAAGLIHHSDQGVQYASDEFQELLKSHKMLPSMSRKGNCYDNAMMESFFGTLKRECIDGQVYGTMAEARRAIFEYIEGWYNRMRLHSSLGYVSPAAFEEGVA